MPNTSCMRCGSETVSTTANIQINAPEKPGKLFHVARPAVRTVEARVCPKCGSVSFWIREEDLPRFRP